MAIVESRSEIGRALDRALILSAAGVNVDPDSLRHFSDKLNLKGELLRRTLEIADQRLAQIQQVRTSQERAQLASDMNIAEAALQERLAERDRLLADLQPRISAAEAAVNACRAQVSVIDSAAAQLRHPFSIPDHATATRDADELIFNRNGGKEYTELTVRLDALEKICAFTSHSVIRDHAATHCKSAVDQHGAIVIDIWREYCKDLQREINEVIKPRLAELQPLVDAYQQRRQRVSEYWIELADELLPAIRDHVKRQAQREAA